MADYKLNELNSISEIRSDDLLHIRVKKRTDMLGDEDRRITYQKFYQGLHFERYLQLTGGTMTGDLGVLNLRYKGNVIIQPADTELHVGHNAKTLKFHSKDNVLTVQDGNVDATIYHTRNKPSPGDLGMRTNAENDSRYAIKNSQNSFVGSQTVKSDGTVLGVQQATANKAYFIRGMSSNGGTHWFVGQVNDNTTDVALENFTGSTKFILGTSLVTLNKTLSVTGKVQPSDWSNFDDRFYTKDAANGVFARLAVENTFQKQNHFKDRLLLEGGGAETIRFIGKTPSVNSYLLWTDSAKGNRFQVGYGTNTLEDFQLRNHITGAIVTIGSQVSSNKSLRITGQVQPSDWSNVDSRYIMKSVESHVAKTDNTNTFQVRQWINGDDNTLNIRQSTNNAAFYIQGWNNLNMKSWYIGRMSNDANDVEFGSNVPSGAILKLSSNKASLNHSLEIDGQVKPSVWDNFDARYLKKSGDTAAKLVIDNLGIGFTNGRNLTIDGVSQFSNPTGWSAMINTATNVPNYPFGAKSNAYMAVIAKRDNAGGQFAIHSAYNDTSKIYFSLLAATNESPVFAKVYTDKAKPTPSELGAYTKAETDAKIQAAVTNSTDLNKIYPVGIVTWFATNTDPNTALPGLTWTYLSEGIGKTIRIGSDTGGDVKTTGGSDSVTLSGGNLPSHTHGFSGSTSTFDYGTKGTDAQGDHYHHLDFWSDTQGQHNHSLWVDNGRGGEFNPSGDTESAGVWTGKTSDSGAHAHHIVGDTWGGGTHSHSVGIGAHSHTFSGETGAAGSGAAFSVTNSFIRLMAWVRTK